MSTLAHAQGGLRPALFPDTTFHPGLQVHSIAEPRTEKRLSLLISIFCYTSMAGLMALTLQHREEILQQIKTTQAVILDPVEARVAPVAPVLPAAPAGVKVPDASASTLPLPRAVDPDIQTTPDALPTVNHNLDAGGGTARDGVLGARVSGLDATGTARTGGGTGPVTEISMAQVQILHQVTPVYPAMARIIKAQGDVVVRMTIDTLGVPSEVRVVSGPPQLQAEALHCARQWRFTPARIGGEAVPAAFNLTLRFVLR